LLTGPNPTGKLDEFFRKIAMARIDLRFVMEPLIQDGVQCAKLWKQTQDAPYKKLPAVLRAIET
jgi:hypothetical protein